MNVHEPSPHRKKKVFDRDLTFLGKMMRAVFPSIVHCISRSIHPLDLENFFFLNISYLSTILHISLSLPSPTLYPTPSQPPSPAPNPSARPDQT
jgi:hypothetical protein